MPRRRREPWPGWKAKYKFVPGGRSRLCKWLWKVAEEWFPLSDFVRLIIAHEEQARIAEFLAEADSSSDPRAQAANGGMQFVEWRIV